jgi:hypothetical protein
MQRRSSQKPEPALSLRHSEISYALVREGMGNLPNAHVCGGLLEDDISREYEDREDSERFVDRDDLNERYTT